MHRFWPLSSLMLSGALLICTGVDSLEDGRQTVVGPVAAELLRVIDGDTIEVRATIWLEIDITTRVRLAGIDAPELNGACSEERRLATLAEAIGVGPVWLANIRRDKYGGRVNADVLLGNGRSAAAAVLASGAAAEWGSALSWCGS